MRDSLPAGISAFDAPRWLAPSDAFLQALFARPELAVVVESCEREIRLHEALAADPHRAVADADLAALADADARDNYRAYLAFRDELVRAGTLEAYYLAFLRAGRTDVPPVFIEHVVSAIVERVIGAHADAFERRAAQLLHRPQRVALEGGRVLAADREVADGLSRSAGFDVLGALREGRAAEVDAALPVLGADDVDELATDDDLRSFVLDLSHEMTRDVGHGLAFTLARAHSGQAALARVLERWVGHLLGVVTKIRPLRRVDDAAWAWHVGLDAESTAILNDLYRGEQPEPARLERLIGLFRLDFAGPAEMRADIAGKPVYLGLAIDAAHVLRMKPQNLLVNLPLAAAM